MGDFPPEIWLHIANLLSVQDLYQLRSLNRTFFNLALDIKWKDLRFSTSGISYKDLDRLLDPFIARRVETMYISLYLDGHSRRKYLRLITAMYSRIRDATIIHDAIDFLRKRPSLRFIPKAAFNDVINTLLAVTPQMINLRELTIKTSYSVRPLLSQSISASYPLLRNLLSTFSGSVCGHTLRKLWLEATLDEFSTLVGSNPSFQGLQRLDLVLKETQSETDHVDYDRNLLMNILAPFLNGLSSHLEELSLKSYSSFDLSDFFASLAHFPCLTNLDVRMAFYKTLRYPTSMTEFIARHSETLQALALPLILLQRFAPDLEFHEALKDWLVEFIANVRVLDQVQMLEIYPTRTPEGLDVLLRCIRRTSKNLREIHIRGRFFTPQETNLILDGLSHCDNLNSLAFNTLKLEARLFDSLASKIPQVERIVMMIENQASEDDGGVSPSFTEAMKERRYDSWNLKHLQVKPKGGLLDSNILYALARSIPSLQFLGENAVYVFRRNETES
ncbi:hypothetical protein BDN70DRAFT_921979 [Pholiota conissans]|uniref:F-box domain-containing protein n=1 Tax=Pholiota conissans TaxID=109636 RepID=A0A9P5Z074_9AGAR|nr:hypothetical protein BDN70DRAFT_921979 [Pholiota conissans]